MSTNRSNDGDRVVRIIRVYESGKVSHRDASRAASPWSRGTGWGRPDAHALPDAGPGEAAPAPAKVKDPRKVAAGKARAAQAKAQREAEAAKAAAKKKKAATFADGLGARKTGKGTPKVNPDAMVVVAFRVTPAQKKKLAKLGGGEFIRRRIEAATIPAGK